MNSTIKKSFSSKPVEIVSGILVTILGVALATQTGWLKFAGSALSAIGSFLTSWIMASTATQIQTRDHLFRRIEQITAGLARISSQIASVARDGSEGKEPPETSFAVIKRNASSLFGIVNDLQMLTDSKVESGELINTAETLMELSNRLERATLEGDISEASREIDSVQSKLQVLMEQIQNGDDVPRISESVTCPECETTTLADVGIIPGESALPTCSNCNSRFHVHRVEDGDLLVKKSGFKSPDFKKIEVECPKCSAPQSLRAQSDDHEVKVRFCLDCYSKIEIDPSKEQVIRSTDAEKVEAEIVDMEGGKYILQCPRSGDYIRSFYLDGEKCYGVCYYCEEPTLLIGHAGNGETGAR